MHPAATLLLRRSSTIGVRLGWHPRVLPFVSPPLPRTDAVRRFWGRGTKKTPPPEPALPEEEETEAPVAEPVSLIHDFDFSIKPSDDDPEPPPPSPADSEPPPEPALQTALQIPLQTQPPPSERGTAFGEAGRRTRPTPMRSERKPLRNRELASLLDQALRSVGCKLPPKPSSLLSPHTPASSSSSSSSDHGGEKLVCALASRLRNTGTTQPVQQMAASAVRAAELWYPAHSPPLREYVATVLALQNDVARALAFDPRRAQALRHDVHAIARSGGCGGGRSGAIQDSSLRALALWVADATPYHFGPYVTGAIHRSFMGYVLGLMADELPPPPASESVAGSTTAPPPPAAAAAWGGQEGCKHTLRFLMSTRKAGGNYELLVHSLFPESQFPEATDLPRFRPVLDELVALTSKLADILAFYRRAVVDGHAIAEIGAAPDPLIAAARRLETPTSVVLRRLVRLQLSAAEGFKAGLTKSSRDDHHVAKLCLSFLEGFARWHCLEEERFHLQAVLYGTKVSVEGLHALD